jgi:hypothetical protein
MKKLFFSVAVIALFSIANAQTSQSNTMTSKQSGNKPALKEHVCTAACKDGKHVYAHGEKGHVCTEACKKKM